MGLVFIPMKYEQSDLQPSPWRRHEVDLPCSPSLQPLPSLFPFPLKYTQTLACKKEHTCKNSPLESGWKGSTSSEEGKCVSSASFLEAEAQLIPLLFIKVWELPEGAGWGAEKFQGRPQWDPYNNKGSLRVRLEPACRDCPESWEATSAALVTCRHLSARLQKTILDELLPHVTCHSSTLGHGDGPARHSLCPHVAYGQIGETTLITQIKWKITTAISAITERSTVLWEHSGGTWPRHGRPPSGNHIIWRLIEGKSRIFSLSQKTPGGVQSITAVS